MEKLDELDRSINSVMRKQSRRAMQPVGRSDGSGFAILHAAASAFLSEYESYRTGDAVAFTPSPEVLEAFRKAVGG